MKKYQSYKESGDNWISEIPSHWNFARTKYVADVFGRIGFRGYTVEDIVVAGEGALSLSPSNIVDQKLNLEKRTYISWEKYYESPEIMVGNGEVILVKTASVGKVAFIDALMERATINPQLVVFKNYKVNSKYFYYYLSSLAFQQQVKRDLVGGVINTITQSDIGGYSFVGPPPDEQTAIVAYLDNKTERIDKLIANKQRLIELLAEERSAIISQAVTKGIRPNVKLRPSGNIWLGDIPDHWQVTKLRYLATKIGSGITPTGGANIYQKEGVPLLRSQNVYSDKLILDEVAYISEEIDELMSNSRIQEDDVLLNITGASIGRSFYVPKGFGRGNVNQHVCIIRPIQSAITTRYLHAVLVSRYGQSLIDACQTGANREGLNFQQIKSFNIPLSDIDEQEQIVEFVETRSKTIDSTIANIEREIELVREYRTALISEVVIGQIKVV